MESGSSASNAIPVFSTLSFSQFENRTGKNDPNSSTEKPSSLLLPGMHHSPMTIALWEAKSTLFEKLLDPPLDAPPQTHLLTRTPSQSRITVLYNFSTDYLLREQYRDAWNEARIGKLLEDLDVLAGTISIMHCLDDDSTTRPVHLVTASFDKIVLKKPISVDTDLKIEGAVTWAGHSSVEIQLDATQTSPETTDPSDSNALTANFIAVARDYKTGKAAAVNRIVPESERENLLYEAAEARSKARKTKQRDVRNGDRNRLGALLADGRFFCDMPAFADRDSILLKDTCLENSLICQPQRRNIRGQIFGGFVMHRAFELAFSTAYAFAGTMPSFVQADRVDFLKPVDVGDLLRFVSRVSYTEAENSDRPLIHVEVVALITRPELVSSEISNSLSFTFTLRPGAKARKNGRSIRRVAPATEEKAREPMLERSPLHCSL